MISLAFYWIFGRFQPFFTNFLDFYWIFEPASVLPGILDFSQDFQAQWYFPSFPSIFQA